MKNKENLISVFITGFDVDLNLLSEEIQSIVDANDGKFNVKATYNDHYETNGLIFTREKITENEADEILESRLNKK